MGFSAQGPRLTFDCSSGNCLCGPLEGLGICSSCKDVTKETKIVPKEFWDPRNSSWLSSDTVLKHFTYETPAGLAVHEKRYFSLEYTFYAGVWNSSVEPVKGVSEDGTIAIIAALKFDTEADDVSKCGSVLIAAHDCKLSWCVKSYGITRVQNSTIVNVAPVSSSLTFVNYGDSIHDWIVGHGAVMPGSKDNQVPTKLAPHNALEYLDEPLSFLGQLSRQRRDSSLNSWLFRSWTRRRVYGRLQSSDQYRSGSVQRRRLSENDGSYR